MAEITNQGGDYKPPHPPRFIGDCGMAKKAGMYEFMLHLTQGFERFEDRWCQTCLLEAGIWWEFKELTEKLAPNEYEELKAKASAELDRRRERSQKSREERQAWREYSGQATSTPQREKRPISQPQNINPVNIGVNTGSGTATGATPSTRQPPQKQEKKDKETTQPEQEEPTPLQTAGKLIGSFARWVATGKTK